MYNRGTLVVQRMEKDGRGVLHCAVIDGCIVRVGKEDR